MHALRGVVRLADGASKEADGLLQLLLCVEVVEGCFAGADPRPDQEVRLVQFTATGPCDIDPLRRADPQTKLAGVELAHFGAFLKGSWRANDWLWGRLDAAQRLLRLLDAAVDNRLSRAGTLERHTAVVQAAVLREELPTLVAELERDAARGAWVTPEATAFVQAVRRVAATTGGRSRRPLSRERRRAARAPPPAGGRRRGHLPRSRLEPGDGHVDRRPAHQCAGAPPAGSEGPARGRPVSSGRPRRSRGG